MYSVIVDKAVEGYKVAILTEDYIVARVMMLQKEGLVQLSLMKVKAINYTVSSKGEILEDAGVLSRLNPQGGIYRILIVLAEIVMGGSERIVRYRVLDSKDLSIKNPKKDDLLRQCELAKRQGVALLQNGIYRVQKGVPRINSYPDKPFNRIEVNIAWSKRAGKVKPKVDLGVEAIGRKGRVEKRPKREHLGKDSQLNVYTEEQKGLINEASKRGVNPYLISNPKLSVEQMKVLIEAKEAGISAEYFADARFSLEVIDFFKDRLHNPQLFYDCKPLFDPCWTLGQIVELYQGIYAGVDVTSYMKPELSVGDMRFRRQEAERAYTDGIVQSKSREIVLEEAHSMHLVDNLLNGQ